MRGQTRDFIKKFQETHTIGKVLDVGSLDVSGHVRDLFAEGSYTGTDMRPGGNVDVVVNGHELLEKFKEAEFDTVVSFDTFEHDDKFWLTLEQMKKVLKPGGWILLGFPSRRCPEHDHPHDYWRFMPQSMDTMLEGYEEVYTEVQKEEATPDIEDEICGWGRKPL